MGQLLGLIVDDGLPKLGVKESPYCVGRLASTLRAAGRPLYLGAEDIEQRRVRRCTQAEVAQTMRDVQAGWSARATAELERRRRAGGISRYYPAAREVWCPTRTLLDVEALTCEVVRRQAKAKALRAGKLIGKKPTLKKWEFTTPKRLDSVVLLDVAGGRLRRRANVSLVPADASASARSRTCATAPTTPRRTRRQKGSALARERLEELRGGGGRRRRWRAGRRGGRGAVGRATSARHVRMDRSNWEACPFHFPSNTISYNLILVLQ